MPQITLNSKQVNELAAFIIKHDLKTYFLAKDDGAYIGATAGNTADGTFENIIFYFRGMDPKNNDEAYDNAGYAFGYDDFGEHLKVEFILMMAKKPEPKVTIKVTATSITVDGTFKKEAPAPIAANAVKVDNLMPKAAAPKAKSKMNKGQTIRHLLNLNTSDADILKAVATTINSIRWHKSKMAKG
jgi:hypothetical protein